MKKDMPLVSVIVPVYNAAYTLKKCVRSLLRQTYGHMEILLIDDGSTDQSGELCDRFAADNQPISAIHLPHQGVSSARNAGLAAATGTYVTFVDADDWLPDGAIAALCHAAVIHRANFVWGAYTMIGVFSSLLLRHGSSPDTTPNILMTASSVIGNDPGICGKLYDLTLIRCHRILFPVGVTFGEDAVFHARYLPYCRTVADVPEIVYCYSRLVWDSASRQYFSPIGQWNAAMIETLSALASSCGLATEDARPMVLDAALGLFVKTCEHHAIHLPRKNAIEKIKESAALFQTYNREILSQIRTGALKADSLRNGTRLVCAQYAMDEDYAAVYEACIAPYTGIYVQAKEVFKKPFLGIKRWIVYRLMV